MKAELYVSNYTTKSNLKNATGADTSKFPKKVDWSNLKYNVDKYRFINWKMYQLIESIWKVK